MSKLLLVLLTVYAACGLVVSVIVHLLALAGRPTENTLFVALHVGIFPMWIPVVWLSRRAAKDGRREDAWKEALSGCPAWLRYVTYGFFAYAFVNFALFMATVPPSPKKGSGGAVPLSVLSRGFSGHWMAFYSVGLATSIAARRRQAHA